MIKIGTYLGFLASSCEGAGKLVFAKHPLVGTTLFVLSGFFWTAEALTYPPKKGRSYWQNIKHKLKLKVNRPKIPAMKWAVTAGIFSMAIGIVGLGALLIGTGPVGWLSITVASLGVANGVAWYQATKWKTTSGAFNKIAAGNTTASSLLGLAAVFAPPLAILGTFITITSYISTAFWLYSYPAQALVLEADKKLISPNPASVPASASSPPPQPPSHTHSPIIRSLSASTSNERGIQGTLTPTRSSSLSFTQ